MKMFARDVAPAATPPTGTGRASEKGAAAVSATTPRIAVPAMSAVRTAAAVTRTPAAQTPPTTTESAAFARTRSRKPEIGETMDSVGVTGSRQGCGGAEARIFPLPLIAPYPPFGGRSAIPRGAERPTVRESDCETAAYSIAHNAERRTTC